MISFLTTMIFLVSGIAQAQATRQSIPKDLGEKNIVDLYSLHSAKKATLSPLSQLKDFEIHLKWSECSKLAPKVFASHKDLQGWIALSWLHCAEQEVKKGAPVASLRSVLTALESHDRLFTEGPWASELNQTWVALRLKYLEAQVAKKDTKTFNALESLLSERYGLNKEQKALVFQLLGDVALLKVNYPEAQFLYEQAQDIKDSTYLQEKIDFLLKIKGAVLQPKANAEAIPEVGEDIRIEERLRQSLKQNELTSAVQDAVLILNQFPGSRAARRLKDKPLEIYLQLPEGSAKNKALNLMQEVDPTRMIEWAQSLHRRADYNGALVLAEAVAEKSSGSVQATAAWWIAGRSAHFIGKYDRALEFFGKLIVGHAGSEEAAEALFRSSLIYYRKKDFSSATALLERLLLQNRDKYDLNGRYWLVRCLQETNPDRAKIEAADLMGRYPFSYYGLRLRAEAQEQKLSWPEPKEKPVLQTDIFLVGDQKKSWARFKILSASGWLSEAQRELGGLPSLKDPTLKISFAEKLAERGQYMPAIRMINDAMEEDPRLRQEQFIKIGYPAAFKDLYSAEAERYGVNAAVLRSLTRQESGFNLRAVSTSNALGLMQMIPPTAAEVSKKLGLKIEIPDDMFRPEINIPMGSFYISQMLDQFQGNIPVALAAYNAGPTKVKIWFELRPEVAALLTSPSSAALDELWFDELPWTETSFYVKAILRNVLLYRLVDEGSFTLKPVLWQDLRNKKAK